VTHSSARERTSLVVIADEEEATGSPGICESFDEHPMTSSDDAQRRRAARIARVYAETVPS
jgi:hypothetical protein